LSMFGWNFFTSFLLLTINFVSGIIQQNKGGKNVR
jgi:hypothetical protein